MGQILEIEILKRVSTNAIYAGINRHVRRGHKDYFGWLVKKALQKAKIEPIKTFPVDLVFDFGMKGRRYDASNCSYMAKLIEDWLARLGVLPDDSPKYVDSVTLTTHKAKADVCFLEIRELLRI